MEVVLVVAVMMAVAEIDLVVFVLHLVEAPFLFDVLHTNKMDNNNNKQYRRQLQIRQLQLLFQ